MKYNRHTIIGALSVLLLAAACKKDNNVPSNQVVRDKAYYGRQYFVLGLNGNYLVFDSLINWAGLADTLTSPGPWTTVVLDNNCIPFCTVANGYISTFNPPANFGTTLRSLILPGSHPLKALPAGKNQALLSLAGNHVYVSKYMVTADSMVCAINGVRVFTPDFPSTNGPLQVLDSIIPNLEQNATVMAYVRSTPELTYFSLALHRTGLDKLLDAPGSNWTLMAPTDAAFKNSPNPALNSYTGLINADTAMLANIIRYHMIPDRNFLFDFSMQLAGADTLHAKTMQGEALSVYLNKTWWGAANWQFIGPGNWNNGSPTPANLFQLLYPYYVADQVTANGTVHELDNILLP